VVFSKVSFGLFIYAIYIVNKAFLFFSANKGREFLEAILCTCAVVTIMIFISTGSALPIRFEYDSLYTQLLDQEKRKAVVLIYFVLPGLTALTFLINRDWRNLTSILSIIFISFFAMHISFTNRTHLHFIASGNLISLFFLAGVNMKLSKPILRLVAVMTLTATVGYVLFSGQFSKRDTIVDKTNWSGVGVNLGIEKFNIALLRLRDAEGRFLVQIPESEVEFWHHLNFVSGFRPEHSRYFMALRVPVLSGRAGYRGYNHQFMFNQPVAWYEPGTYGFRPYYDNHDPCIEFSRVLTLTSGPNGLVEKWNDCKDLKAFTEPLMAN
jgi:hypothetical protein